MTPLRIPADDLASLIAERAAGKERFTVAIAGAPGAGKSTLAATLATALGSVAMVVPMDGFHFDNAILEARGQMAVKGAPETFDVAGFSALLARLATEDAVAIPILPARALPSFRAIRRCASSKAITCSSSARAGAICGGIST